MINHLFIFGQNDKTIHFINFHESARMMKQPWWKLAGLPVVINWLAISHTLMEFVHQTITTESIAENLAEHAVKWFFPLSSYFTQCFNYSIFLKYWTLFSINWFLSDNYVGEKGTSCKTGIIEDEIECKNAVKSLGITIDNTDMVEDGSWVESTYYHPKGCFLYITVVPPSSIYFRSTTKLYFNKVDAHIPLAEIHSRPICRHGKSQLRRLDPFSERI